MMATSAFNELIQMFICLIIHLHIYVCILCFEITAMNKHLYLLFTISMYGKC